MVEDIKKIKAAKQQDDLEKEVKDVQTGRLEVEVAPSLPEEIEATPDSPVEPAKIESSKTEASGQTDEAPVSDAPVSDAPAKSKGRAKGGGGGRMGGRKTFGRKGRGDRRGVEQEFEQRIVDLARVTRVMAGGKRMRFRACVIIGDRKGRVAMGLAKGRDVTIAISKAVAKAKKDMINLTFVNDTIPFETREKFKAAQVLFRPAKKGKGIIAGGAVRVVLELAGVPNVVAKILGTNNKMTNVKATIQALKKFEAAVPKKQPVVKPKDEKEKTLNSK